MLMYVITCIYWYLMVCFSLNIVSRLHVRTLCVQLVYCGTFTYVTTRILSHVYVVGQIISRGYFAVCLFFVKRWPELCSVHLIDFHYIFSIYTHDFFKPIEIKFTSKVIVFKNVDAFIIC